MTKILFTITIMFFLITGCQTNHSGTEIVVIDPPQNLLVAKPDEIYVGTPKYVTRVKEDSPWFNAFWTIADKGVKATEKIERPQGVAFFDMYGRSEKEPSKEVRSIYELSLLKPLKEGETVPRETNVPKGKEDASVFMVLWYRDLLDLKLNEDQPTGAHLLETKQLGYPVSPDGTHHIKQIMFDTEKEPEHQRNAFMFMLWSIQNAKLDHDKGYVYAGAFDGQRIDDNKYNLPPELIQTYEKFRKSEVKINEKN